LVSTLGLPVRRQCEHAPAVSATIATLDVWHELVRKQDPRGLDALLADEVVFHSPVVHTPQPGKAITLKYLAAAFQVLCNESFRYVREIHGPGDAALEFQVEIDGVGVNGIDLIKWNEQGRIVEFKVMIRPLKAVNLIHQKMAAMLQAGG
jgi:ketosteroid isomerase-like protein